MAVSIVATAKSASANSYATLAEAEAYMLGRANPGDWTASAPADDTKNRALVTATNRLEELDFYGTPTDTDQRLKWPRVGTYDMDNRYNDQDVVPRLVKEAQYELALAIINGEWEMKDTGLEGFKSAKAGPVAVEPYHGREAGTLPREVMRKLRGLVAGGSGINVHVSRS